MLGAEIDETSADTGPRDRAARTERLCIVTRTVNPVDVMIRFVVSPDQQVLPDVKRSLPGRGVWVSGTREAVSDAVRRNLFARGFRKPVKPAADLVAMTDRLLEQAVLDALAMVRKSGLAETGFTRVESALSDRDIVALIHASDAAADGVRKVGALARRRFGSGSGAPAILTELTSAQLDLALGRSNVIHAALLAGPASKAFLARYQNLLRFRGKAPADGSGPTGGRDQAEQDQAETGPAGFSDPASG